MLLNLPLFTGLRRALLFNYPRDTLTLNTYLFDRFLQKKNTDNFTEITKKKAIYFYHQPLKFAMISLKVIKSSPSSRQKIQNQAQN